MDWNDIKAHWSLNWHRVHSRWERIGEEDFNAIAGDRERLFERIQTVYGISAQEALRQIELWEATLPATSARAGDDESVQRASGGGTHLHGDKLSQPADLDDEAQDELRESVRPGEATPQRDSGTAPSQTHPDQTTSRSRQTERRGS